MPRRVAIAPPAAILLAFASLTQAAEKAPQAPKTRTELLNELSLRSAQVALEGAREEYQRCLSDYENTKLLFEQSIIDKMELDTALSKYTRARQLLHEAEIKLEETKLSFLDHATHITIVEAKKYSNSERRRMLDIELKNTSNLAQAESALAAVDPNAQSRVQWQNPESLRALLDIENIIVSIISDGASIGKPYEAIIPLLSYGKQQKITFELLADVEQTGVKLQYLNQTTMESIYLEKESLQKTPSIVASQFALEGPLGGDVGYALDLEMLVTSDRNFSVAVTNMPPQIRCFFVESGSRITSVYFSEDVSKHSVTLNASIPEKLDADMIDKRIDFQAWIATLMQLDQINKLRREYEPNLIPEQDMETIEAAHVDLTLIPRGTGRLEIQINNLYKEIEKETEARQEVDFKADLYNDGTLTLFNITPEVVSRPLDWTARVDPNLIEKLEPDEKRQVTIYLTPPLREDVGEYQAEFTARGQSGSEVIEAMERQLKVKIYGETNITATTGLVFGLVVLITGIVFVGVRLSRR